MMQRLQWQRTWIFVAAVSLGIAACGDDDGGDGMTDSGTTDTGVTDTGATDTGMTDTGMTDSGVTDSGVTDTGSDAGTTNDIQGLWVDGFGGSHWITEDRWQSGWGPGALRFAALEWDTDAMWLVAQNDSANAFNPDLFSRFEWTFDGEQLYYCQSVFDGASADDARDAERADPANLDTGCGGFGWSSLTEGQGDLAILGEYTDGFGTHTIDDSWTQNYDGSAPLVFAIGDYSNVDQWLVAQNDSANEFNPDLFSRFEWTWTANGDLAYCQSVFDGADEASARDAERADADDLDEGCAGFPWTTLTVVVDEE